MRHHLVYKKAFYFKPFSYSSGYCQQDVILTYTTSTVKDHAVFPARLLVCVAA